MIKIIRGHFGHHNGQFVELKNKESEPFSADAKVEAQLVNEGVAEYVEGGDAPPSINIANKPEYDESMKIATLKEIAATKYDVKQEDLAKCIAKKAVIALIEAKKLEAETTDDEEDEVIDDNDAPPSIDAVGAVQ